MDILGGLFVLAMIAVFGLWHMPDALRFCEAKIFARRAGLRAQKEAFTMHLAHLRSER